MPRPPCVPMTMADAPSAAARRTIESAGSPSADSVCTARPVPATPSASAARRARRVRRVSALPRVKERERGTREPREDAGESHGAIRERGEVDGAEDGRGHQKPSPAFAEAPEQEVPQEARVGLGSRRLLLVDAPEDEGPGRARDRDRRPFGVGARHLAAPPASPDDLDEVLDVVAVVPAPVQPAVLRGLARGEIEAEEVPVLVEKGELRGEDELERVRERPALLSRASQAFEEDVGRGSDRLLEDLVPGAEIEVDRALRDARLAGDVIDRRLREPLSADDAHRGLADRATTEFLDHLLLRRHKWNVMVQQSDHIVI